MDEFDFCLSEADNAARTETEDRSVDNSDDSIEDPLRSSDYDSDILPTQDQGIQFLVIIARVTIFTSMWSSYNFTCTVVD